jgi:hypothetical protein
MDQLPEKTRVSDPCPRHQDQRGQNPGSERAGATAAAPTISEPGRTTEGCVPDGYVLEASPTSARLMNASDATTPPPAEPPMHEHRVSGGRRVSRSDQAVLELGRPAVIVTSDETDQRRRVSLSRLSGDGCSTMAASRSSVWRIAGTQLGPSSTASRMT